MKKIFIPAHLSSLEKADSFYPFENLIFTSFHENNDHLITDWDDGGLEYSDECVFCHTQNKTNMENQTRPDDVLHLKRGS